MSPAPGTPCNPSISTGVAGNASVTASPRSENIARILPENCPTINGSPTRKVPCCTNAVATAPRPLSSLASRTTPDARRVGLAFRARISAWSRTVSSKVSRFVRCLAETSTISVSPPHSVGCKPSPAKPFLTLSIFAPGLSILLIATMIGTPAAFECSTASIVCGMTPSSAATTKTTMSVALAPRARIIVNASWPGVSRKTTRRGSSGLSEFGTMTLYAPMCCVIPPASPSATLSERIASRSEVLPWSTWPITVTTGARGNSTSSASAAMSSSNSCSMTISSNGTKLRSIP